MNLKNLFKKKNKLEEDLTVENLLREFGKSISYKDAIKVLPRLSKEDQEKIKEGIYEKQKEFWGSPEQIKFYSEYHSQVFIVQKHYDYLATIISPKDGEVIVDLGCGWGPLIKKLLEKNKDFKIIGIDFTTEALKDLSKSVLSSWNKRVELINYDLTKGIPLPNESADKVVSNWGLSFFHYSDLERSFSEVYRVLKSGGVLVFIAAAGVPRLKPSKLSRGISIIKETGLGTYLKIMLKTGRERRAGVRLQKRIFFHFPVYSIKEILEMLEKAGLKIIKKEDGLAGGSEIFVVQKT